ncbi:methyltransferase-like protein [Apiospora hydei]|uniref:Methyltransferase-like protein n=1 Tax=Apiospora hydei TaxID=1337664 RepID=A0ABR1V228_9PEZI
MASAEVQIPAAVPFEGITVAKEVKSHDVDAVLHFHKPNEDGSPPEPTYIDRPETYERPTDPRLVRITDVTGRESSFTLDGNGFQFVKNIAEEKDFVDDERIKAVYYPEVETLLKNVTGASKVFIFDHTIRRGEKAKPAAVNLRGPVQRVHIDQSYRASLSRVPHHLPPDEAESLLRGRVQIINVWRPIATVQRDPLAVAEAASVAESDLVPIGLIYPDRRGETLAVAYNPQHRWYYKHALTPEEALLIKCFDTKTDGRARRVPHTAFSDPDVDPGGPARESIEVRCLVFHPEDQS